MSIKILSALVLSVLISGNVMAASGSGGHPGDQGSQSSQDSRDSRADRRISRAESVPELDGSMAFLALGLTFAAAGLVREKRRTR